MDRTKPHSKSSVPHYSHLDRAGMVDESGMMAAVTTVVAADRACARADPPRGIIAV